VRLVDLSAAAALYVEEPEERRSRSADGVLYRARIGITARVRGQIPRPKTFLIQDGPRDRGRHGSTTSRSTRPGSSGSLRQRAHLHSFSMVGAVIIPPPDCCVRMGGEPAVPQSAESPVFAFLTHVRLDATQVCGGRETGLPMNDMTSMQGFGIEKPARPEATVETDAILDVSGSGSRISLDGPIPFELQHQATIPRCTAGQYRHIRQGWSRKDVLVAVVRRDAAGRSHGDLIPGDVRVLARD